MQNSNCSTRQQGDLRGLLLSKATKRWIVGDDSNIEGRDGSKKDPSAYWDGARFASLFREARADDFRGFETAIPSTTEIF